MRPIGSAASLEKRRRGAVELFRKGKGIREIARQVRASPGSVHLWIQNWKKKGDAALISKPPPGRPKKLTPKQREKLQKLLLSGAMACGFPNELWTLKRIATLTHKTFGVRYHQSHLWRILKAFGWSCQVPERRAVQRDEATIKKSPKAWSPSRLRG